MSSSSPPNKRRKITFIGPPPKELTDIETLTFVFRNFKNLKEKNGEWLISDPLMAHNYWWSVALFPKGRNEEWDGCVSFYLECQDSSESNQVEAKFRFRCPHQRPVVIESLMKEENFNCPTTGSGSNNLSKYNYIAENCLDSEGSFIVDVDIQVYVEKKPVWYPKRKDTEMNPSSTLRHLLESNLESDVSFVVGDGQEKIHAHKCVLAQRAPGLYEFIKNLKHCEEFELPDINVTTFKILLEFIYTGDLPKGLFKKDNKDAAAATTTSSSEGEDVDFDFAKNLLFASNRFGIVYLKLWLESEILAKSLTIDNAADWLCIADAHICPLLKEECMKLFVKDKSKFKSSSGWKNVKESFDLLEELLDFAIDSSGSSTAVPAVNGNGSSAGNNNGDGGKNADYHNMSVRMLREELESKDMDLDGTKTMLIQRLKDFHDQKQNPAAAAAAAEVHTD